MIVPMKKVSLIVMDREREASLKKLRELGIVHLEKRSLESEYLLDLLDKKQQAEKAIGILESFKPGKNEKASVQQDNTEDTLYSAQDLISKILTLYERRKNEQEALASDYRELSRIKPWGNFDPAAFNELMEHDLLLIPYELPKRVYEALDSEVKVIVLSKDKNTVRCLVLDQLLDEQQPFILPELSQYELEIRITERKHTIDLLKADLTALYGDKQSLVEELSRILKKIEFESARVSMECTEDGPEELQIAWISGYVPHYDAGLVRRAASENSWAMIIDDVSESDSPPSLVKNNPFVRIIKPIFDLLGTVPGYREYDISLSFLLFFTLFFAMIFGDAGYGVLLLSVSLFFSLRMKIKTKKVPDIFLLLSLLSGATIVWGAINGTWFALPIDSLPGFLQAIIIPPFYPDPSLDPKIAADMTQQNIKHLCFIIASVQLVLAHIKNILKLLPSLKALAQLGWLALTLGFYYLVLNLVLDPKAFPIPSFALYLMGIGLLMYFLFSEQNGGNFFRNVLRGFANFLPTFLSAVSGFSDIISYIRLFAVGLAGYAIAESFNGMAMGVGGSFFGMIAALLILVFGHGLNLAMNSLSVIVHGVRLNMLEYSGRLGMEWSGVKYAPFAQDNKRDL